MSDAILGIRKFLSPTIGKKRTSHRKGDAAAMNNTSNGNGVGDGSSASGSAGNRSNGNNGSNNGSSSSSNNNRVEHHPPPPPDANALLPQYLYPLVRHYHDDFYVSRSFDPRLIVQLMAEGFLPIATRGYLLPKLHVERCVLQLNPESKLHISKSTRKKSKRFLLSVNECFDRVVAGCHRQHGTNWLYPPIVNAFRAIHERTKTTAEDGDIGGVNAMIMNNNSPQQPEDITPVRLYSVEIWNAETGALAGGELGYSVGGIYSSLTGFSEEDAAGSSQLVALGKLLTKCGFEFWDLGMDLEYKRRLGAKLMGREDFVAKVKRSRVENKGVVLQCGGSRRNAKELVDWVRPMTMATTTEMDTTADTEMKQKNNSHPKDERNGKRAPLPDMDHTAPQPKRAHEEGKGT